MASSVYMLLHGLGLFAVLVVAHGSSRQFARSEKWTTENSTKITRRELAACGSGNPIDDCWSCNSNWRSHLTKLADCAVGYGENAAGGRNGVVYVVTDSSDNPSNPEVGTLRYAATRNEALWITFDHNMNISLQAELKINSFKTVDGRGAEVHITKACFTIEDVEHVIIHGLHFHDCERINYGGDTTDGDGINVKAATNIWIDHNSFSNCVDGLVDVNHGSDSLSITNNRFTDHNKVMLLGNNANVLDDKAMRVTVAFNVFGPGLVQRMPRCRLGTFHVANNYYKSWSMYAIGGSANPTISSEGNYFDAGEQKLVTKNFDDTGNLRSVGDLFLNGAWFEPVGASADSSVYANTNSFTALRASQVPALTANAGPIS